VGLSIAIIVFVNRSYAPVDFPLDTHRAKSLNMETFWPRGPGPGAPWAITTQSMSRLLVKCECEGSDFELWAVHVANDHGVDLQLKSVDTDRVMWKARLRDVGEAPAQASIACSSDGKYVAMCFSMGGGMSSGHLDFYEIETSPNSITVSNSYALWDPWHLGCARPFDGMGQFEPKTGFTNNSTPRMEHLAPDLLEFRRKTYPRYVKNWCLNQQGNDWVIAARVDLDRKFWQVCLSSPVGRAGRPFMLASKRQENKNDARLLCQVNLGRIKAAKKEWMMCNRKQPGDECYIPGVNEYVGEVQPHCPANGIYRYGLLGEDPQCTVHGVVDDAE
jgi:hypothetical protein